MSAHGAARIGWPRPPVLPFALTLAGACLAWGVLFRAEIGAAVGVWYESTAYGHCFLVLPTAAFLAWDRRDALAGVIVRPTPWPVLAAGPVVLAWFAAERLGVMEARQLAALALLLLTVLACVGWQACRAMAAPLAYLVFLVPFGAFLTPVLQQATLDLTMALLAVADIPAVSDGFVIEVPHATFYVAEACAGLRFLIASVAFGTLYACLVYRTAWRRAVFIAAAVAIPVLANGVRAFGIVALGYTLGSAEAAAADHLVYGWIFFSVVILLLILAGLPFRQDSWRPARRLVDAPVLVARGRPWAAAGLLLAASAAAPAAAMALDRAAAAGFIPGVPELPVQGCAGTPLPAGDGEWATALDCPGAGRFTLRVATVPARATYASIQATLRRVTGESDAEEVHASMLAAGTPIPWTLVETAGPARMTAVASWQDGHPAQGGLAGRLAQARDSLLGTGHAPVVVGLTWEGDGGGSGQESAEDIARHMVAVLAAQTGWPGAVERISRQAAR